MKNTALIERMKRLVCVGTLITENRFISILQQLKQSIGKLQTVDLFSDGEAQKSASGVHSCSPTDGKRPGGYTGHGVAVQLIDYCSSGIVQTRAGKGNHQYQRERVL